MVKQTKTASASDVARGKRTEFILALLIYFEDPHHFASPNGDAHHVARTSRRPRRCFLSLKQDALYSCGPVERRSQVKRWCRCNDIMYALAGRGQRSPHSAPKDMAMRHSAPSG